MMLRFSKVVNVILKEVLLCFQLKHLLAGSICRSWYLPEKKRFWILSIFGCGRWNCSLEIMKAFRMFLMKHFISAVLESSFDYRI